MRKLLIAAALMTGGAIATPAAAQYYDYDRPGYADGGNIDWRLDRVHQRIERSVQRGRISGREADRLFREAAWIDRLYDRYRRNGLSRGEERQLRDRIRNLRHELREDRRDGRWDRDDRWRDRDWDRDDRWDDDDDDWDDDDWDDDDD